MSQACLIYATVGDAAAAESIGRILVAERLAAAANFLPGLRSVYWWQGELRTGSEALLVLKTRADLAEVAVARLTALHAYACPGVVILPVLGGNPAYLDWIAAESRPAAAPTR